MGVSARLFALVTSTLVGFNFFAVLLTCPGARPRISDFPRSVPSFFSLDLTGLPRFHPIPWPDVRAHRCTLHLPLTLIRIQCNLITSRDARLFQNNRPPLCLVVAHRQPLQSHFHTRTYISPLPGCSQRLTWLRLPQTWRPVCTIIEREYMVS